MPIVDLEAFKDALECAPEAMNRRQFVGRGLSLALTLRAAAHQAANRAAVVVGVDSAASLRPLKGATAGAQAIAQWLSSEGFATSLLVDNVSPVSSADVFSAISAHTRNPVLELLVVYFAGHGFSFGLGEFWLLSDAVANPNAAVNVSGSISQANGCGVPNVVFVSDACRSTMSSLRMNPSGGALLFPNPTARIETKVDVFYGTSLGAAAFELPSSSAKYDALFTRTLLDAFRQPPANLLSKVNGQTVVTNRKLEGYLKTEVRRQAAKLGLDQVPQCIVPSADDVYIAKVASAAVVQPEFEEPLADVRDLIREVGESDPERFGMTGIAAGWFDPPPRFREPFQPVPRDRFIVRVQGAKALAAVAPQASIRHLNDGRIEIDLHGRAAASVLLRLGDTGTVVAAIPGHEVQILVGADGRVLSVDYKSWAYRPNFSLDAAADSYYQYVNRLVQRNEFTFDTSDGDTNASNWVSKISTSYGVDLTLALLISYACEESSLGMHTLRVWAALRKSLGIDIFDVALLSGAISRTQRARAIRYWGNDLAPRAIPAYPCCPMLTKGWTLASAKDVDLAPDVVDVFPRLLDSLWTTLDSRGVEQIEAALQAGRLQ